ncbi:MAG: glycosyltransferase family 2 protein [Planctomycetota bacterium]|nr:glycosyltransferase family 2 protein [Planctomycetota bacterium]
MSIRWLTALPVYNEAGHVDAVLNEVSRYSREILVVNDGSTDGTGERLAARNDIHVVTHASNRGYGAGLRSAFEFAIRRRYDYLVTIDCDGQHEPQRIPNFVAACRRADIVSGSRYLKKFSGDNAPPEQRRWINRQITGDLNELLGLHLTDAFCGFKAYRVEALQRLQLVEDGYAMPLELWVQAVAADFRIVELAVPLIYLEEERSFGGDLDDGATRLNYYQAVLERSLNATGLDRLDWMETGNVEFLPG